MRNTLLRNIYVLQKIPKEPRKVDIASLISGIRSAGLGTVSARTLQRDLVALARTYPLICDSRSKPYGWSFRKDSSDSILPMLTPATAVAIKLAEPYLRRLLPVDSKDSWFSVLFREAEAILSEASQSPLRAWQTRIRSIPSGIALSAPRVRPEIESVVYEALIGRKALALVYRPAGKRADSRFTAHPLALVAKDDIRYLVYLTKHHPEPWYLPLHRIRSAEPAYEDARDLPGFDIDQYIRQGNFQFPAGNLVRLELRVEPGLVTFFSERALGEDQRVTRTRDDAARLRVTVRDTHLLRSWLLSLGGQVEVLKPATIRGYMKQEADRMSRTYAGRR